MNNKTTRPSAEPRDVPLLTAENWQHVLDRMRCAKGSVNHKALTALINGDTAVYNTSTHRVVPIEAKAVAWRSKWVDRQGQDNWYYTEQHPVGYLAAARRFKVIEPLYVAPRTTPPEPQSD